MSRIRAMPHSRAAVDRGRIQVAAGQSGEEVHAYRANQRLGERVIDQRVGALAGQRASHCDAGGGGAHAGGQVPSVVVGACHAVPPVS